MTLSWNWVATKGDPALLPIAADLAEEEGDEGVVLAVLEDCGAVLRGRHFVYTSGQHGSAYINKDALYVRTTAVSRLCLSIAAGFRGCGIEAVAGPAIGGVILSQWVAHHSGRLAGRDVAAVYAEPAVDGSFAFRRGYDRVVSGRNVLVVEDVLTTGGSLRRVIEAVAAAGGIVTGVAALVNRGGVTAEDVGSPAGLLSLVAIELDSYAADECPLCRDGIPIDVTVGKGRDLLTGRPT
jgi:orotate phosphoribosyltransferase